VFRLLIKRAIAKHANNKKVPLAEMVQFVNSTIPLAEVKRKEKNRDTPLLRVAALPRRKAIQGVRSPRARE
jgi:hypothetical protein